MRPGISRAFLIYTALICLCISDGVGPRLLPYPASTQSNVFRQTAHGAPSDLKSQSDSDESEVGRETSKDGDDFKKLPVLSAPGTTLIKSALARQRAGDLSPPGHTPGSTSLRSGRAPPLTP